MSATSQAPAHLLERLSTLHSYVKDLAVRCGQDEAFATEMASAAETATRARASRSRTLVERAIVQHRELAQAIYSASRTQAPIHQDNTTAAALN